MSWKKHLGMIPVTSEMIFFWDSISTWNLFVLCAVANRSLLQDQQGSFGFKEYLYGCFRKQGYPQTIHFNRVFHYKPSILGYPYNWKHPCIQRLNWLWLNMWYHFCWRDSPKIQIKRQISPIWLHTIYNPQGWIAICTDPTGKHMCQPFPLLTPKKGKPKTQTFQKAQMHKAPLIKLPRVFICLGPAWPFFGTLTHRSWCSWLVQNIFATSPQGIRSHIFSVF